MTVLDVGSGNNPKGDFNIDPFIDDRHRKSGNHGVIKDFNNFILGSGCSLPFRDRSFTVVRCQNVIEHIENWHIFLRELWRVTEQRLIIICPHRMFLKFPKLRRSDMHISNFDRQTFDRIIPVILRTNNFDIQVTYRGAIHKLIPFPMLPHLIIVNVYRD